MKKRILFAGALGVGGGLWYLLSRLGKGGKAGSIDNGHDTSLLGTENQSAQSTSTAEDHNPIVDDHGTDQFEAANILKQVRDAAFDSSDEKLALALGRPTEEIEEWTNGSGLIDGDVVMKARGLALERGAEIS